MDRDRLARRNQQIANAKRRPTVKQRTRDLLLAAFARLPVAMTPGDSERLLIVRPDHIGDVLLSTPAIQALKRWRPELSIHVLCGEWSADVLAVYPEIDRVLTLPFPGFLRGDEETTNPWRLALSSARTLRNIGYGGAIILRPDHWWGALVSYLAGIRVRVGYDVGSVAPLLTEAYPFELRHAVEQNMRLVELWTGAESADDLRLQFPVQACDRQFVDKKRREWTLPADAPQICIHPGSGMASKVWLAEKWAATADTLSRRYGATIVFTGTEAESALIADILDSITAKASVKAGSTTVGQLAALYERSLLVLGPDSGALHLAAAVNTPTVALFGPADSREFAPWGDERRHAVVASNIACRPCRILDWGDDDPAFHPCVRDISVETVLKATQQVLRATA